MPAFEITQGCETLTWALPLDIGQWTGVVWGSEPTNANSQARTEGGFTLLKGCHVKRGPRKEESYAKIIKKSFYLMFLLGSEGLVSLDPAVASKYRFCAPLNGCRRTGCMGLLRRGLPADLLSFSSPLVLTFLIFLVRCDLSLPSLIQHNHISLCIMWSLIYSILYPSTYFTFLASESKLPLQTLPCSQKYT